MSEYKIASLFNDPVYRYILFGTIEDRPYDTFFNSEKICLEYKTFLSEELRRIEKKEMTDSEYKNYLKKGVVRVLKEKKKKECKRSLLSILRVF